MSKIGNLETAANKQKEEENNTTPATSTVVQSGERVELSNTSVEYSNAAEKMEEAPKDRSEKIESLKMKISNDSYNVDSTKIAEKIIKDSLFNTIEP